MADLCVEALADSEAALLDRIVDLTIDRNAYKVLAQQLLHELHREQQARRTLQERYGRLVDEYLEFRQAAMKQAVAA